MNIPNYLKGYEEIYRRNPREAGLQWFREARYGLFIHYGLYSLLGRHEWVQLREKIPVAEYAKLIDNFTADKFDADAIAQLAVDAGMKYVNITTRHHDSFCLFDTNETPFNSMRAPSGRDLLRELAEACDRHGLGLSLYYSHGRDWKHPHAPNNDRWGGSARPQYDPPDPAYAYGTDHILDIYIRFMENQIRELLTNYGPIATVWIDGIAVPLNDKQRTPCPQPPRDMSNAEGWRVQELYDLIHSLQPQVIFSYKQGLLGTEDYFSPEHSAIDTGSSAPMEVCTTMCPDGWGYVAAAAGKHRSPENVWELLRTCRRANCNLLLNTGPLPDGSLDTEDADTLRRVGERLQKEGFPQ